MASVIHAIIRQKNWPEYSPTCISFRRPGV